MKLLQNTKNNHSQNAKDEIQWGMVERAAILGYI
jgi:hypothetical protein